MCIRGLDLKLLVNIYTNPKKYKKIRKKYFYMLYVSKNKYLYISRKNITSNVRKKASN